VVNRMAARRDVYIVGAGQIGYGEIEDKRLEQIIFESCSKALSDAKVSRDEIVGP
jgi:acetyl-CoA acetyltransferase